MKNLQNNKKDKYDYYYDAMEFLVGGDIKTAEKLLQQALKIDKEFVDAYNGLSYVYKEKGNRSKAKEFAQKAFYFTQKKFSKWPEEMSWGWIENRQYFRAVCNMAIYYHEDKNIKEAEKLYKLLLKMNPNDNQGVRYLLSALYANKHPKIVDELIDKGNMLQDWSELEKLLEEQNKKYKFWKEYIED